MKWCSTTVKSAFEKFEFLWLRIWRLMFETDIIRASLGISARDTFQNYNHVFHASFHRLLLLCWNVFAPHQRCSFSIPVRWCYPYFAAGNFARVATAQGKQAIWIFNFLDRENTGNLPEIKNNKNLLLNWEFPSNTGEIFEVSKIKLWTRVVVGCFCGLWLCSKFWVGKVGNRMRLLWL